MYHQIPERYLPTQKSKFAMTINLNQLSVQLNNTTKGVLAAAPSVL